MSWRERTYASLVRALGADNLITLRFHALQWVTRIGTEISPAYVNHFERTREQALGLLDAAVSEIGSPNTEEAARLGNGIDADLWEFVRLDVAVGAWGKAVSQACLFLEDRVRRWAGRPTGENGERLMIAVFGETGIFRLGETEGEKQGWNLIAMGISKALRNAAGHRISDRQDHEQYAMGVIGACSLLVTQLKHEHGDDFRDG